MKSGKMKDAMDKKIGFIGSGYIAEAIISGIVKTCCSAKNIFISDINNSRANFVCRKYRVVKCSGNLSVVKSSDIIFITVKPNQIADVLEEIAGNFDNRKLLISVAAGIKTSKIEKYLGKVSVVRVMPNTPALIGIGAIALTPGRYAKKSDLQSAKKLLSACGIVVEVKEKDMDTVTAVSGSGPAYVFYVAEIMMKTAVKLGLEKEIAEKLVNQTLLGASKMLILSDDGPEVLRRKVTSKGGTTESAFKILTKKKFGSILEKAIISAKKRATKLSNG